MKKIKTIFIVILSILTIQAKSQLTVNISAGDTTYICNGSSASITTNTSGGTTPYSYSWSSGETTTSINPSPSTKTKYTVTVTDAVMATASDFVVVKIAADLSITGTQTHIECNGNSTGAINTNISGGIVPYSYSWSNGASTLHLNSIPSNIYTITVTDFLGCTKSSSFTITEPSSLTIADYSITHISCNGSNNGSINISTQSGTSPYIYNWSNGFITEDISNIPSGTYHVTVTDSKGCYNIGVYTITEPTALTLSNTITHIYCNGGNNGAINIASGGGTPPYTYSWSTGAVTQNINGRIAGTYSVTVRDANSCTKSSNFTITQPTAITLTSATTHINCNGGNNGAISITRSGGTTPYTYSWNSGNTTQNIIGRTAGTYTITITDANLCTKTGSYSITQPAAVLWSTGLVTHINCNSGNNGAINITTSGGTPVYSYSWNTGATSEDINNLITGIYSVTVTDLYLCTKSSSFTITQPSALNISSTITHVAIFGGNTGAIDITTTGGTPAYTYSWSNSKTTEDNNTLTSGFYTITVTDAKLCTKSSSFTITEPNIYLTGLVTHINCYGGTNGVIEASLIGGTSPITYIWNTGETTKSLTSRSSGNYSVTVTDNTGITKSSSFTITEPTALTINATIEHVPCQGASIGSISLNSNGGVFPHSYNWNTGETSASLYSKPAGTYTITVTDNKLCTKTASYVITEGSPTTLNTTATITHVNCYNGNNGTIFLNTNGGIVPYSYIWSNGSFLMHQTNLIANTYSVTIEDALGCTKTFSYSITQPSNGTPCNQISGKTINDLDSNCTQHITETGLKGIILEATPGFYYASTDDSGKYVFTLPDGSYTIKQLNTFPGFKIKCPTSSHTATVSNGSTISGKNFYNTPYKNISDLAVTHSSTRARLGMDVTYSITYSNFGTSTIPSGKIKFYSDTLIYKSCTPIYNSINNDTLIWDFSSLNIFENKKININFSVPITLKLTDTLKTIVQAKTSISEINIINNLSVLRVPVSGAWDPNDKLVNPIGRITGKDSILTYTIRFQNTGNDTALNIYILDTLSSYLNVASFIPGASSHPYSYQIYGKGTIRFDFKNILLPDSNVNKLGSQGFVSFSIKQKKNLVIGTQIKNSASIYFDLNAPVKTNTVNNTYDIVMSKKEIIHYKDAVINLYPNPAKDYVLLDIKLEQDELIKVYITTTDAKVITHLNESKLIKGNSVLTINTSNLKPGNYFVNVVINDELQSIKLVKE